MRDPELKSEVRGFGVALAGFVCLFACAVLALFLIMGHGVLSYSDTQGVLVGGYILVAVLGLVGTVLVSLRPRRIDEANVCPRCGYDLRGAPEKGCSACGWGREEGEKLGPRLRGDNESLRKEPMCRAGILARRSAQVDGRGGQVCPPYERKLQTHARPKDVAVTEDHCDNCGEFREGSHKLMFYSWITGWFIGGPVQREFICFRCQRRSKVYALIALGVFVGGLAAAAVAISVLGP